MLSRSTSTGSNSSVKARKRRTSSSELRGQQQYWEGDLTKLLVKVSGEGFTEWIESNDARSSLPFCIAVFECKLSARGKCAVRSWCMTWPFLDLDSARLGKVRNGRLSDSGCEVCSSCEYIPINCSSKNGDSVNRPEFYGGSGSSNSIYVQWQCTSTHSQEKSNSPLFEKFTSLAFLSHKYCKINFKWVSWMCWVNNGNTLTMDGIHNMWNVGGVWSNCILKLEVKYMKPIYNLVTTWLCACHK